MSDLFGWYSSAEQASDDPDHDPPHDAACPYCGNPLTEDDVRTHSFVPEQIASRDRCYFYRTHRTCDEAATQAEKDSIFSAVIERIRHTHGLTP